MVQPLALLGAIAVILVVPGAVVAAILPFGAPQTMNRLIASKHAPAHIAPDLTLISVTRQDLHVTHDFRRENTGHAALGDATRSQITAKFCAGMLDLMQNGSTFTAHCTNQNGAEVASRALCLTSCSP